jgi:hypothetical protein
LGEIKKAIFLDMVWCIATKIREVGERVKTKNGQIQPKWNTLRCIFGACGFLGGEKRKSLAKQVINFTT